MWGEGGVCPKKDPHKKKFKRNRLWNGKVMTQCKSSELGSNRGLEELEWGGLEGMNGSFSEDVEKTKKRTKT